MATKEEKKLYEALLNAYNYNLLFLKEYDNELFLRVSALSDAITSNIYPERFFLEFLRDDGEFDIYDSNSKTYLYNKKPKKWNKEAIKSLKFNHNSTINLLSSSIIKDNIVDLSAQKDSFLYTNKLKIMSDIANYKNIKYESISNKNKSIKEFNKFIFVGTLLGRHIPKIIQKLKTINHFVCEANLEIFRLSLFTCDYSLLARDGKSVVFSIMDDEDIFNKKFDRFFKNDITNNTVYKYYSTNYNIENYFDRILNNTLNSDPLTFDYRLMLDNIVKNTTNNFNKYQTLNFSKRLNLDIFKNKDVLFVGAGPSLQEDIKWLQKNQDRFIIVSMGASVKKLFQYDIKPDIITSLDPQGDIVYNQFKDIPQDYLENCIKLFSLNTHKKVFDIFKNSDLIYTFEILKSIQIGSFPIDGFSIGEATFKILLLLNIKNIYLLGLDLALNQQTGSSHIDTHSSNKGDSSIINYDKQANQSVLDGKVSLKDDTIVIKGNFQEKVTTTRLFSISLLQYNSNIHRYKQDDQNIYNISKYGAYIEQTTPLKTSNIDLSKSINKKSLLNKLQNNLNSISILTLSKQDLQNIKDEIITIKNIIALVQENINKDITTYPLFKENVKLIDNCIFYIDSPSSFLPEIYINFHFIINRYIDFIYNTREARDDRENIKDTHYIWSKHIIYLMQRYINYLDKLVD